MKAESTDPTLVTGTLARMDRKIRMVEEKIENLKNHIDLVENNLIETNNAIAKQGEEFTRTARDLRKQMQTDLESFEKLIEQINNLASKDSVAVLEKYVDILDPLKILDREDVEEIIDEKLKSKKD
jgi:predicted  nucleic acid-binding Zn-ribbon protein